MARNGFLAWVCVSFLSLFLNAPGVLAHDITVDGNPADWTLTAPTNANTGHIGRNAAGEGEYIWTDAAGDQRTDFPNSEAVDIRQFRVTSNSTFLFLLVELDSIDVASGSGAPQIQMAIDIDHVPGSGEIWLGSNCDTQVNDLARWEYLLITRFGSGNNPILYLPGFVEIPQSSIQAVLAGNFIEISIPWSLLPGPGGPLPGQLTVVSLRADENDIAWEVPGVSDVMDAVTNYADPGDTSNTWAEVSDGSVDYHFQVWFHLDPDIEPSPPLVINELLYDPVVEPDEEWVELFNRTGLDDFDLEGFKFGDEETYDGGEGMAMFPLGFTIGVDDVVVVARSAVAFETLYGFYPYLELTDTTASVADMLPYPAWATGAMLLANTGDEVLLVDPFDTIVDVLVYGTHNYPGMVAHGGVAQGHSLERIQARPDTNDCTIDFFDQGTPTPGQVVWLGALGDSCNDGVECDSGFCANGVCCENACDGACDLQCDPTGTCLPVTCPPPLDECGLAVCDPVLLCDAASGTVCDDSDACTENTLCDGAGNCLGDPVTCPPPANDCERAACDSTTGCFEALGTSCDDADACTENTQCDGAGACGGGTPTDCGDGDDCTVDGCDPGTGCSNTPYDCDDSNVCTDDFCDGDGTCSYDQLSGPCDDGDPCSRDDTCISGVCTGTPYDCDDTNPCTDDTCLGDGTCDYAFNTDTCDDGYACTANDVCDLGTCAGTLYSCDDGNPCTDDYCNGDGTCSAPDNNDPCDDGDACTEGDQCLGGSCFPGPALDCDDANPCTDDSCDSAIGCVYASNTDSCDDNDMCTIGDVCSGGNCAGTPVTCNDANPCTDDSCDPAIGCVFTENTILCDDGNACTDNDICSGGSCAGVPVVCDDMNPCTDDTCDPASGCVYTPNSSSCDDGDACTENDTCSAGMCSGSLVVCNDNNPCTDDSCDPGSGCVFSDNTALCDDGDPCTENDFCLSGTCQGAPKDCSDNDVCTDDSCEAGTGNCLHDFNTDPCNDADACTQDDVCAGGVCGGQPVTCDDNNTCTNDTCDPATGCVFTNNTDPCDDADACTMDDTCSNGVCSGVPLDDDGDGYVSDACGGNDCNDQVGAINPGVFEGPFGDAICADAVDNDCDGDTDDLDNGCDQCAQDEDCDDNDVCNGQETCLAGLCQQGTLLDCDDSNPCTNDSCDAVTGCASVPNSAACDDGDACTEFDTCTNGNCVGSAVVCDDMNPCTDEVCDSGTGCVYTHNTDLCDDGDSCTLGDICVGGVCTGVALDCTGLDDACNVGECDPGTGTCQSVFRADGTACDDGDACSESDGCFQGICSGALVDCDDSDPCTDDACDPASGCQHTDNTALCDDGDLCTETDVCSAGSCAGTPIDCSAQDDECHVGVCDPATGLCMAELQPDGTACDDSNPCTESDLCASGTCRGTEKDCSSLVDPCNDAACNLETGACEAVPITDGTLCDDQDECTAGEHCVDGLCTGGLDTCEEGDGSSGCGCATPANHSSRGGWALFVLLGFLAVFRRRKK